MTTLRQNYLPLCLLALTVGWGSIYAQSGLGAKARGG